MTSATAASSSSPAAPAASASAWPGAARPRLPRRRLRPLRGRASTSALAELERSARTGHRHPRRRHRRATSVQALWDHAVATFGQVDVWINNAGISAPRRPLPRGVRGRPSRRSSPPTCSAPPTAASSRWPACRQQPAGGWIWNMEGFGSTGQVQPGHGDVRRLEARGDLPDRVAGQGDQGHATSRSASCRRASSRPTC